MCQSIQYVLVSWHDFVIPQRIHWAIAECWHDLTPSHFSQTRQPPYTPRLPERQTGPLRQEPETGEEKRKKKREGLNMFKSEVGKKGWVRKKAGVKSSSWLGKVAYSILHFRSCYSDPRLLWASPEKSSFPFLHTLGTLTDASLRHWSVHTNISLSHGFILGKL